MTWWPDNYLIIDVHVDSLHFQVSIMKMLCHPNIVNLIEVIDDPETDHFYMGISTLPYPDSFFVESSSFLNYMNANN